MQNNVTYVGIVFIEKILKAEPNLLFVNQSLELAYLIAFIEKMPF